MYEFCISQGTVVTCDERVQQSRNRLREISSRLLFKPVDFSPVVVQKLPLSIDVSYPHGAQQQTRRTPLQLRSTDGTD